MILEKSYLLKKFEETNNINTKIEVIKTKNKNSYCHYVDGIFFIKLAFNHDERIVIDLIDKLVPKISIGIINSKALKIDFETNSFNLFGNQLVYEIDKKRKVIFIFDEGKMTGFIKYISENTIESKIKNWIKKKLFKELENLQRKYEEIMQCNEYKILIKEKNNTWGTNSRRTKTISYSFKLHNFAISTIESVVVHELAHDKISKHSNSFFSLIKKYFPDYDEKHAKLNHSIIK
ncbi:YgjP-like metallopeptidase domain-containing protein [Mycoplasma crocodyli]|uniref:Conserved hypothetical metal-dependent peptidase n=1 Tax=Mycoplasma crocodyli (strain ATCC 51981 / MP145) TaxID=512564 RepID=D5E4L9_MYCCM|nr:YgjP-like metallopeptidase domain-containing protein [Mycoplasma crocodyli]ADE19578.1 conserved hypothetical metal-dependent peptidase [Mycoplasma crocodyli MP145]